MHENLRLNGSGYYDPTAYVAIKHYEGGYQMNNGYDVRPGDIYRVKMQEGGSRCDWLILEPFEGYASAIRLNRDEPEENSYPVHSVSVKYADTGRLGYIFYDKLDVYVKTIPDDELTEVKRAIGRTLGITTDSTSNGSSEAQVSEKPYDQKSLDLAILTKDNELFKQKAAQDRVRISILEYMYNELMDQYVRVAAKDDTEV